MPAGAGMRGTLLREHAWLSSFTTDPTPSASSKPPDPDPNAATAGDGVPPGSKPPDPIAGGQAGQRPGQLAMEYPMTGIINDIDSKTYMMAPDYWVSWDRVQNPGGLTETGASAPPAVWWQQRTRWRDTWNRLKDGDTGTGWRWKPRYYPDPSDKDGGMLGNAAAAASAAMFGGSKLNKWWNYLDGREKPDASGSPPPLPGAAGPKKKSPNFMDGGPQDPCQLFPDDYKKPVPAGCFCPGPRCVYDKEQGYFGWETAKQRAWEDENMMRRQTLPGLSDAVSENPTALRHATVRLGRMQEIKGKEAATLDPRPPQPVENPLMPGMSTEYLPKIKPYDGGSGLLGAAAHMVGNSLSEALIGANMLELKAFMRLQNQTNGEWMNNLMKYKKAQQQFEAGNEKAAHDTMMEGKEEQEVVKKRKRKRDLKGMMDQPPEPLWAPPPPQKFSDLYEMRYRKFWPAMEILARRSGSGPGRVIEELGQEWRSARVSPHKQPNAIQQISESAGGDVRAAKRALGGPSGRQEEEIDAVDMELPVPQPEIRQARPMDLGVLPAPTPTAGVKAYIARDAPPRIAPGAAKLDGLERELMESRRTGRDLDAKIQGYNMELRAHKKLPKAERVAKAEETELTEKRLQDAEEREKDAMAGRVALTGQVDAAKRSLGDRFVEVHPAGQNGAGVETKVPAEVAAHLGNLSPEEPEGPTTYAGMNPVAATAGAVVLSSSRHDMQLARDARLARWRPARRPGRRRLHCDGTSFL